MAPLSENRVRMLAGAMLVALALVYCINVLAGRGRVDAQGDIIGCDFLAFYGAGLDVRAGRTHLLYDLEHQRRIQQPVARNPEVGWTVPGTVAGYRCGGCQDNRCRWSPRSRQPEK